jgi:hypothetical protein
MATGIASALMFAMTVSTSSAPSCRRYVIVTECAKGHCFIHAGLR